MTTTACANINLPLVFRLRFFWDDNPGYVPEIVRLLVESALARGDLSQAEMFVRDYKATERLPQVQISRFVPGDHFYVLDTKFATLEEAKQHARANGYRVAGNVLEVDTTRVTRSTSEGD